MKLLQMIDEDFTNYKQISMFLGVTRCDGKCWRECGLPEDTCQNHDMYHATTIIDMSDDDIIQRYLDNPMTSAIVIGGLEPFMDPPEIYNFIDTLRNKYHNNDTIVIYTGYNSDEIDMVIKKFQDSKNNLTNIIIKFGRFVPGVEGIYDPILGVTLASHNQYAQKVS